MSKLLAFICSAAGRSRKLLGLGIAVLVVCGSFAAVALAGGGSSIAGATAVVPGQQEFGSTNDALDDVSACGHNTNDPADYWKLSLMAGDHVTIDWETQLDSSSDPAASDLAIYPAGTTDFSVTSTNALECFTIGSNNHQHSVFVANADGSYPMVFVDSNYGGGPGSGGPYDFTVHLLHKPVLNFVPPRTVASGSVVTVAAHYPDGKAISSGLQARIYGSWQNKRHQLGAAAVASGVAKVTLRIPRRVRAQNISVYASVAGSGFVTVRTPAHRVRTR